MLRNCEFQQFPACSALGVVAALLVSLLCWTPLIRGFMNSIRVIRHAVGEVAEGNFEVKIPIRRGAELGELGASIEKMSKKLSMLVHGQRRFLADVAHELCAPLSRIQLSSGIPKERMAGPDLDYIKNLERDVRHISNLAAICSPSAKERRANQRPANSRSPPW
jgi:two-component system, OmpR family, sensor histidine kinase CpxA